MAPKPPAAAAPPPASASSELVTKPGGTVNKGGNQAASSSNGAASRPSSAGGGSGRPDSAKSVASTGLESSSKPTQQSRWAYTGSWRGKANAVAELAKDSVQAASATASTAASSAKSAALKTSGMAGASSSADGDSGSKRPGTLRSKKSMTDSLRIVRRSNPTTQMSFEDPMSPTIKEEAPVVAEKQAAVEQPRDASKESTDTVAQDRPLPASGWGGWWTRPLIDRSGDIPGKEISEAPKPMEQIKDKVEGKAPTTLEEAGNTHRPESPSSLAADHPLSKSSWFGLWAPEPPRPLEDAVQGPPELSTANIASDGTSPLVELEHKETAQLPKQARQAGAWAFWSRDAPAENGKPETGQVAVAATPSESNPKPAQAEPFKRPSTPQDPKESVKRQKTDPPKTRADAPKPKDALKPKADPAKAKSEKTDTKPDAPSKPASISESQAVKALEEAATDEKLSQKVTKSTARNLLLPTVHETLRPEESQSYLASIFRMFGGRGQPRPRRLALVKAPPKVQHAVAIGVHGYFPAPLVQRLIGQPTGTSLKFANNAAAAIERWTRAHGYECETEKVALEGEGMIAGRTDTLWKLLLNFLPSIRKADLVVVAAHSQGVPVAAMLLARLISFGCLQSHTRLVICAMAGVSLGPFASYQSRLLGTGSASELFEFSRHDSPVSRSYREALEACLAHGTRVCLVGSIDDQLVGLDSSLFATAAHPYIFRAVFVDGRIHAPGFVTALVGLACKLRNLGTSDHGLLRELSAPLAGSLYAGEGHSRLYDDEHVYDLAIVFGLETANLHQAVAPEIARYEIPGPANANPYFLPWAMRGVLEEPMVRQELQQDLEELLKYFEDWRPATKQLKDVKMRLEGLRSKL